MNKTLVAIVIAAVLAALAWFALRERPAPEPAVSAPAATPARVEPEPEPIRFPAPEPATAPASEPEPPAPLPALGPASDPEVRERVAELIGEDAAAELGLANDFVRRLVVTLDNLPRERVPVRLRPIAPAPGGFEASGDEERPVLTAANAARYEPLVRLVADLPADQLVDIYARLYPLFQEAYVELGYPDGYFNDRLVEVIDHLLAAPEVEGDIELVRPHVMYKFADPRLEALSPGHKLLVRIGPDNARALKAKLRELRAAIVAGD